jgi:hypothetical protein
MLLSDAERGFILSKQADSRAAKTIIKYRWMFRLLLQYFDNPPLISIGTDELRRFFAWMQTEYQGVRPNGDKSPL